MFVGVLVKRSWLSAIAFRRDHGLDVAVNCGRNDGVGVVGFVGQQLLRVDAFYKGRSLRTVSGGTVCNNNSDRHTMRIHGQMYLGVKPPFERLMA